jgi:preprotein translocase subunit SecE
MNKIVRFFQSTRIVIISTALIALTLGLVDLLIFQAINLIF